MNVIKCDNCGRDNSEDIEIYFTRITFAVYVDLEISPNSETREMDLCQDCLDKFLRGEMKQCQN